jgi:hypothetical protein
MPLPFLKKKDASIAGIIMKTREPDTFADQNIKAAEGEEKDENKDSQAMAIEACAEDLIKAVHSRDVKAAAQAMRDAFDILESMPHEEIEHDEQGEY